MAVKSISALIVKDEPQAPEITVGASVRIAKTDSDGHTTYSNWGSTASLSYYIDSMYEEDCDYITLYGRVEQGYTYSAMTWDAFSYQLGQWALNLGNPATLDREDIFNHGSSGFDAELRIRDIRQAPVVSYNGNGSGATGVPSSQTTNPERALEIPSQIPTRSGHSFLYWNANSSGTGSTYYPGQTYTFQESTTLFAIWRSATYTITYNANGGTGAPAAGSKPYGQTYYIASGTPSKPGFRFVGWSISATATAPQYVAGNPYTANADLYLYAVWVVIATYTVSFNANGGSGAPSTQTKTQGIPLTLSAGVPTRDGYLFTLWNTSQDGSGQSYAPGATYTNDASITLYAQWETSGSKNVYVWINGEWRS